MKLRYVLVIAGVLAALVLIAAVFPAIRMGKSILSGVLVSRTSLYAQQSDWDDVIRETTAAISLDPKNARAYTARAYAYVMKRDWDHAFHDYDTAIRLNPKDPGNYDSRGYAYQTKEQWDLAIADFDSALKIAPNDEFAFSSRGYAHAQKHEFDRAISDFSEALKLEPRNSRLHGFRGNAYVAQGDWAKATADFDEAIRLGPTDAASWGQRGYGYAMQGQWTNAAADFDHAITLDPNDPESLNEMAWLRATCPDASLRNGDEAVRLSTKACNLAGWKTWNFVDTVAAAYAESGDFDKAVQYQSQAVAAEPAVNPEHAAMQQRLELYRRHKPYRETVQQANLEKQN